MNKVCLFLFVINDLKYFHSISQLVGFIPEIGRTDIDNKHEPACNDTSNIPVQCIGEVCFKILK
jgi:hypothetical protein